MKKFLLTLILTIVIIFPVWANNCPDLKLKKIQLKDKITNNNNLNEWSYKIDRKNGNYYTKVKGFGNYYDYLYPNKDFAFTTDCEFEFLYDKKFIGYSNKQLQFYEINFNNGVLTKTLLQKQDIQKLLPDYKVINLSEFSDKTNSFKIKKGFGSLKLMLINDKNLILDNYKFTTGNSDIEQFEMSGVVHIKKSGMIEFSGENVNTASGPWFIILVR